MVNEKTCTLKWWIEGEPFSANRLDLLNKIKNEAEAKSSEIVTNEATVTCDYCGCDYCGQPLLLRECADCGSTLCGCHILPEEHDCHGMPTERSWGAYSDWQNRLR
jgi:predicted nucleic acid binding AN1-type Zn finger protein